ncbi:ABC transporter ATP-binding protein [Candidatus Sumerlaeota bacterium]|nr:ABC transporter ATP-binding protein [Candidatus Sumerlaeota bacterium]
MIDVENLTKFYGANRSLDGVSFHVGEGEILGFLGPNGAGKSTTMRCLTGIARPTEGSLHINNLDVQRQHEQLRGTIGYLPEQAPLYGDMTVSSYLEFLGGMRNLDSRNARREMERTTDLLGLKNERKRLLRNLSKGTRQRAALAGALVGDPKILILDEPTAGLDPAQIGEVRSLIRSLKGNRTVILSTHILPEVELTCSSVVIIAQGRIAAQGTHDELLNTIERELVIIARGSESTFRDVLRGAFGDAVSFSHSGDGNKAVVPQQQAEGKRGAVAKAIVDAGLELLELSQTHATLEDVFLRVTQKMERGA